MKNNWIILFLIIFLNISTITHAHPWKPAHFVIIDTDCGFDDFRAINMLLASSSIRVLAIISSNGVLSAKDGYIKLKSMLKTYYSEGILLGMNTLPYKFENECIPAKDFIWGINDEKSDQIPSHTDILKEVIKNSSEKITFINLGSLSTYNSALKELPELKNRINQTIWSCNFNDFKHNFNYMADPSAYLSVLNQNVRLTIVDGNIPQFDYTQVMNDGLGISNIYAKNFERSLKDTSSPYSKMWNDESIVLYLHKTEYFNIDSTESAIRNCKIKSSVNQSDIKKSISIILAGLSRNQNQVFSVFPMDTSNYTNEINAIMPECLEKYGQNEWVATVLTNEMHRHLGIYAVIGSKMGIRAREYFGAGIDEMQIVSYAGFNPPYSCMNDGLQISTGATLGHGLIKLKADTLKLPKADFIYMDRKISISLKDEYRKRVESEIKNLVFLYSLDTNIYWDLVRKLAIDYWKFWDRHEIFDLETFN